MAEVPVLILPAGYAFAIWPVIYALCSVFVVYQAIPYESMNTYLIFDQIKWWFTANIV